MESKMARVRLAFTEVNLAHGTTTSRGSESGDHFSRHNPASATCSAWPSRNATFTPFKCRSRQTSDMPLLLSGWMRFPGGVSRVDAQITREKIESLKTGMLAGFGAGKMKNPFGVALLCPRRFQLKP